MECKTYIYKACSDGTEISADVYFNRQSNNSKTLKPIALLIYGGGWTVGSRRDVPKSEIELLLELGFVAVSIDHRLCPTINLFDGPITDSRDALDWCQTKLPDLLQKDPSTRNTVVANGSKVVTVGWSAGGHLALMLSQAPRPPQAILTFYPVTGISDPYWHVPCSATALSKIPKDLDPDIGGQIFNNPQPPPTSFPASFDFSQPRIVWMFSSMAAGTKTMACIGDGNIDRVDPRTFYIDPDPVASRIGKRFPPLMVIHGDADDLSPLRLSVEMVEFIRRQGGVAEIDIVEGKEHGFDMVSSAQELEEIWPRVRQGFEFLNRFV